MGDLELNARFRTALKQGNLTRIEECLDQEAVDPNMKVVDSIYAISTDYGLSSLPWTPQAMFHSPRQ